MIYFDYMGTRLLSSVDILFGEGMGVCLFPIG